MARRLLLAIGAPAVASLCLSGPALAGTPSDDHSAGNQYVESVPDAGGSRPAGSGGARPQVLPAKVLAAIERDGGKLAPELRKFASSPRLGSPSDRLRASDRRPPPTVPSAVVGAAGSDPGSLVLLLLGIVSVTALTVGSLGYRRYTRRPPDA